MRASGLSDALGLRPLEVRTVLLPLSSSTASDSALGPARELAEHFGAQLRVLTVGIEKEEVDAMAEHVAELTRSAPATLDVWVDWDVSGSILAASRQQEGTVVCMASHARGRLGELVLGSYTSPLLADTTDPVLLVGPDFAPARKLTDGPVWACVDGSPTSEQVIPVAARWASALDVPLEIVTVAEPALAGLDERDPSRGHGRRRNPRGYVGALAEKWQRPGLEVSGYVVFDPIGAAQGLAEALETRPCGMLAVTTHAHSGLRRVVFGSQATAIVRHSPVPVLVVPPEHDAA